MKRSYHGWHSRFDQPDPWDGSYDLSDPQSFNRYTYVQNDPVNYVDSSGLLRVAVLVNCRTNWVWKEHVEGCGDWYDMGEVCELMVIEVGGGEVGGGGGGAAVTVQRQNNVPQQNDCQRFADMVQDIANRANSRNTFLDELARTFTAANDSSISEMRRTANMPLPAGRPTFGASGFKEQFRDNSNQVRHFVGGFIAGARIGWIPARTVMNRREEPNTNGENDADIELNEVSTYLGAGTIGRGIAYIRRNIAEAIRKQVCK